MSDAASWERLRDSVLRGATESGPGASAAEEPEIRDRLAAAVTEVTAGTYSTPRIHLLLERAAARGATRSGLDRVAAADAERRRETSAPKTIAAGRKAQPAQPHIQPGPATVSVVIFLLVLFSPFFVLPALRSQDDWAMDLEPGAILSGIVALLSSLALLWVEARRSPTIGTRTGLFPPLALLVPAIILGVGVGFVLVRMQDYGPLVPASIIVGVALLTVSVAIVLVTLVVALRSRRTAGSRVAAGAPSDGAPSVGPDPVHELFGREAVLDAELTARIRAVVADDPDRAAARAAVVAGVGELYLSGELNEAAARELLGLVRG